MQALAEVKQLQLLCSEREQCAHTIKLQLDAALSCDAEREEQIASALAAAAALQEERAALLRAREDALLQSARASVAADAAELTQSKHRHTASPSRDAGHDAEFQQCAFPMRHTPLHSLFTPFAPLTL